MTEGQIIAAIYVLAIAIGASLVVYLNRRSRRAKNGESESHEKSGEATARQMEGMYEDRIVGAPGPSRHASSLPHLLMMVALVLGVIGLVVLGQVLSTLHSIEERLFEIECDVESIRDEVWDISWSTQH